ncbi:unannotated protein [freshwater metagenome]|uniref:Unannotated protein n=1 Tax=freshwater metagenome TaxID=449393 RepID=A0A6J6UUG6_9ZZZZ
MTASADGSRPPLLRVISGEPTEEELAAIIAAVSTRSSGTAPTTPTFSLWARKSRQVRPAQRPGFGAWRASTMPR